MDIDLKQGSMRFLSYLCLQFGFEQVTDGALSLLLELYSRYLERACQIATDSSQSPLPSTSNTTTSNDVVSSGLNLQTVQLTTTTASVPTVPVNKFPKWTKQNGYQLNRVSFSHSSQTVVERGSPVKLPNFSPDIRAWREHCESRRQPRSESPSKTTTEDNRLFDDLDSVNNQSSRPSFEKGVTDAQWEAALNAKPVPHSAKRILTTPSRFDPSQIAHEQRFSSMDQSKPPTPTLPVSLKRKAPINFTSPTIGLTKLAKVATTPSSRRKAQRRRISSASNNRRRNRSNRAACINPKPTAVPSTTQVEIGEKLDNSPSSDSTPPAESPLAASLLQKSVVDNNHILSPVDDSSPRNDTTSSPPLSNPSTPVSFADNATQQPRSNRKPVKSRRNPPISAKKISSSTPVLTLSIKKEKLTTAEQASESGRRLRSSTTPTLSPPTSAITRISSIGIESPRSDTTEPMTDASRALCLLTPESISQSTEIKSSPFRHFPVNSTNFTQPQRPLSPTSSLPSSLSSSPLSSTDLPSLLPTTTSVNPPLAPSLTLLPLQFNNDNIPSLPCNKAPVNSNAIGEDSNSAFNSSTSSSDEDDDEPVPSLFRQSYQPTASLPPPLLPLRPPHQQSGDMSGVLGNNNHTTSTSVNSLPPTLLPLTTAPSSSSSSVCSAAASAKPPPVVCTPSSSSKSEGRLLLKIVMNGKPRSELSVSQPPSVNSAASSDSPHRSSTKHDPGSSLNRNHQLKTQSNASPNQHNAHQPLTDKLSMKQPPTPSIPSLLICRQGDGLSYRRASQRSTSTDSDSDSLLSSSDGSECRLAANRYVPTINKPIKSSPGHTELRPPPTLHPIASLSQKSIKSASSMTKHDPMPSLTITNASGGRGGKKTKHKKQIKSRGGKPPPSVPDVKPNRLRVDAVFSDEEDDEDTIVNQTAPKTNPPPPRLTKSEKPPTGKIATGGGGGKKSRLLTSAGSSFYFNSDGDRVWLCPVCLTEDDGNLMIGCDICDDWYHGRCLGMTSEPTDDKWYCPACAAKKVTGNSIVGCKKLAATASKLPITNPSFTKSTPKSSSSNKRRRR